MTQIMLGLAWRQQGGHSLKYVCMYVIYIITFLTDGLLKDAESLQECEAKSQYGPLTERLVAVRIVAYTQ